MTSAVDTSQMNNSLSDLLESMDGDFNGNNNDAAAFSPFCKEGETVMTKDSLGGTWQSFGTPQDSAEVSPKKKLPAKKKATKRGAKKKDKKAAAEGAEEHGAGGGLSLGNTLSHLPDAQRHHHGADAPTVATMDSVQNKHKGNGKSPRSRRGGKRNTVNKNRNSINNSSSLETSLSEMLHDPDQDDDDDDDNDFAPVRHPRESGTVDTLDSAQRHKYNSTGSGGRTKRGSKRGGDLSLTGGPAPHALGGGAAGAGGCLAGALDKLGGKPRDFGRQADDNDTFCGLGTVGERELRKQPLSKQSPTRKNNNGGGSGSGGKAKSKVILPSPSSSGGKKKSTPPAPKPFMMCLSNDDDDDSEEEEDLFQDFGANPFRTPYQ